MCVLLLLNANWVGIGRVYEVVCICVCVYEEARLCDA